MRIVVECENNAIKSIPINYQYYLTSAIYNALRLSDERIAQAIHDDGFGENKHYKFFTYSYLKGNCFTVKPPDLRVNKGSFQWYISSPMQKILDLIINGLLIQGRLEIKKEFFDISKIDVISDVRFRNKECFSCFSPIVVSKTTGNKRVEYLTFVNEEFNEQINKNLKNKYEILFNEEYKGIGVRAQSIKKYPSVKLIKFKNIYIKGIYDQLILEGDSDLIHIAYDSGLGEKNSMGFGMLKRRRM